jgi:hypothetical protein
MKLVGRVNGYFSNLITRYFASRQKRQEYIWGIIDNWAFGSSLPTGRQASSVPKSEENKATGIIANNHILVPQYLLFLKISNK